MTPHANPRTRTIDDCVAVTLTGQPSEVRLGPAAGSCLWIHGWWRSHHRSGLVNRSTTGHRRRSRAAAIAAEPWPTRVRLGREEASHQNQTRSNTM